MYKDFKPFDFKEFLNKNIPNYELEELSNLEEKIKEMFIGKEVRANHPITVFNPSKTFIVKEIRIEKTYDVFKLFVKGDKTCWFGNSAWQKFYN